MDVRELKSFHKQYREEWYDAQDISNVDERIKLRRQIEKELDKIDNVL